MNPVLKNQLRALDRAILSLLDERTRLLEPVASGDPARACAIEDMLRRHDGPYPAESVRAVFGAIDVEDARAEAGS